MMDTGNQTDSPETMPMAKAAEAAAKHSGIYPVLGALPDGALVSEDGLAEMLGKCRMSIRRSVKRGELPPATRIMGKRCWTAGAIVRHIEARLQRAKDDAQRRERRLSQLSS